MSLDDWVDLPPWLSAPANAVLDDLQRGEPVPGLTLRANEEDGMDGPVLGLFEPDGSGGGRLVSRSLDPLDLLLCVAEILQDELMETSVAWGQSRPPCPHHPHPARPSVHDGEAWWECPHRSERLYHIGGVERSATSSA